MTRPGDPCEGVQQANVIESLVIALNGLRPMAGISSRKRPDKVTGRLEKPIPEFLIASALHLSHIQS